MCACVRTWVYVYVRMCVCVGMCVRSFVGVCVCVPWVGSCESPRNTGSSSYASLRKSPHVPSAYGVAVYPNIGLLAGKCTGTCQF